MQRPKKIENMKKFHARAREVLQHGVNDSVRPGGSGKAKLGRSCKKFSADEKEK